MHIKLFFTQQHCYIGLPKNLIPWWDSNHGLVVPETDAMSSALCHLGICKYLQIRDRHAGYRCSITRIFAENAISLNESETVSSGFVTLGSRFIELVRGHKIGWLVLLRVTDFCWLSTQSKLFEKKIDAESSEKPDVSFWFMNIQNGFLFGDESAVFCLFVQPMAD
jgi:hypothetical protein